MQYDDPWRDPERQRWLLGLDARLGVDHLFREFFGYHLDPTDPEVVLDGPGRRVMSAISRSVGPVRALWKPDVRDTLFAESVGDAVAGLALAQARVLHEGGELVGAGVGTASDWAWASEHGAARVDGAVLQGFLFTAVGLALADPPPPLRELVTDPATPPAPDPVREASHAIAAIREALAHHQRSQPVPASVVVRARLFDRQWRDIVASHPDTAQPR
jgi:hypothetical protein